MATYEGTYGNLHYSSIYPKLFRARYKRFFADRVRDIDKIVTGYDEIAVRSRIQGNGDQDIRGAIKVEWIMDLAEKSDENA